MSSPPLPYSIEDVLRELQRIAFQPLPPEAIARANEALAKEIHSQQYANETIAEIKQLAAAGIAIDTKFKDVDEVVKGAIRDPQHLPKVGIYHQTYVELLWASRAIVGQAKAAATDFEVLLEMIEDTEVPVSDKKAELLAFSSAAESRGAKARDLPSLFHNLEGLLERFSTELLQGLIGTPEGFKDKDKIAELKKEIAKLEDELKKLNEGVVKPLVIFLKLSDGVFVCALSGSPVAALDVLVKAALEGVEELKKYKTILPKQAERSREINRRLIDAKAELAMEQLAFARDEIGNLYAISELIVSLRGDITALSNRIAGFTSLWDQLKADSLSIIALLDSREPPKDPEFSSKITLLRQLLPRIAASLTSFSATVDQS